MAIDNQVLHQLIFLLHEQIEDVRGNDFCGMLLVPGSCEMCRMATG